ncbi:MAG: hypothetical protein ACRCTS_06980 [Fusobacteriaceae bacterium]
MEINREFWEKYRYNWRNSIQKKNLQKDLSKDTKEDIEKIDKKGIPSAEEFMNMDLDF